MRPWKRYQFTPIAARVPSTVATNDEVSAIITLFPNDDHSFSDEKKSLRYQLSEKPDQDMPFALLNEYTTMTKRGRNRKMMATVIMVFERETLFTFWRARRA
jgi:hypothetical protein